MRLARAAWETLHEPRVVSLVQSIQYLSVGTAAGLVLASPRPTAPEVLIAGTGAVIGSLGATLAAWRGWCAIEAYTASLVLLGLLVLSVEDIIRDDDPAHWPGWTLALVVALSLALAQRILITRGRLWEAGREPSTRLTRAQARVQVAKIEEQEVIAKAREINGKPL